MMNMEWEDFLQTKLDHIIATAKAKGRFYAADFNRFHNFDKASRIAGKPPECCAWDFAIKHLAVADDIMARLFGQPDWVPTQEDLAQAAEVFGDIQIYTLLIEGMLHRRASEGRAP